MADHSKMKCGKLARAPLATGPQHLGVLVGGLPATPDIVQWGSEVTQLGVMLNDQINDCVVAAYAHWLQLVSAVTGNQIIPPDSNVEAEYSRLSGFVPGNPATDTGMAMATLIGAATAGGVVCGYPITGVVSLDWKAHDIIRAACFLFGGVYLGVRLALNDQTAAVWTAGDPADPNNAPGSWAGHSVTISDCDGRGGVCITWGQRKEFTWDWIDSRGEEAYGLLSPIWAPKWALSPSGYNWLTLWKDFRFL